MFVPMDVEGMGESPAFQDAVLGALGAGCEECARVVRLVSRHLHRGEVFGEVARQVGLSGVPQLSRWLRRHGVGSLQQLRDWLWLCEVVHAHVAVGWSLEEYAYRVNRDPSVVRRMVKRVTQRPWVAVKEGLREEGHTMLLRACAPLPAGRLRCREGR